MPKETITIALTGEVTLGDFAKAINTLHSLLSNIGKEVEPKAQIEWNVADLQSGSAIATFRGIVTSTMLATASAMTPVANVITAYENVGHALETHQPIPYKEPVQKDAKKLAAMVGEKSIKTIRFETDENDAVISSSPIKLQTFSSSPVQENSYGSVRGRVQSLTSRTGLRFTLYDANTDCAISCYVTPGQEETLREIWGRLVRVQGRVKRDPATGLPSTVRDIRSLIVIPEMKKGGWREAIGASPMMPGEMSPVQAIRMVRNG